MFKEAAIWSVFYIGVAIAFGVWVWQTAGSQFGTEYFAAYLVEKSLSVDNLFVFIIILAQFKVPSIFHQRVLMFGVILALVLRAILLISTVASFIKVKRDPKAQAHAGRVTAGKKSEGKSAKAD